MLAAWPTTIVLTSGREAHRVVDRQTGSDHTAGAVDVQVDVLVRFSDSRNSICAITRLGVVIDRADQEDHPLLSRR